MDRQLYSASPSSSSSSPSPPSPNPRPTKVAMQREYRLREGECINTLRDIIHKLTGEAFQTRHEILSKAIELLLACPAAKSKETRVSHSTTPRSPVGSNDAMLDLEYQTWHAAIAPDAQMAYYTQFLDQEYTVVSGTNPAINGGSWFHQ